MSSPPAPVVVPPEIEWDDELWELIWERRFDQVERHAVGRTVLRGRLPEHDPLYAAVGRELALRWRRTLRNRALLWGTWIAFWLMVAFAAWPEPWAMPAVMALLGTAVTWVLLFFRHRLLWVIAEADRRIRNARARRARRND